MKYIYMILIASTFLMSNCDDQETKIKHSRKHPLRVLRDNDSIKVTPKLSIDNDFTFDEYVAVEYAIIVVVQYEMKNRITRTIDYDFSAPYALFSIKTLDCDNNPIKYIFVSFSNKGDNYTIDVILNYTKDGFVNGWKVVGNLGHEPYEIRRIIDEKGMTALFDCYP